MLDVPLVNPTARNVIRLMKGLEIPVIRKAIDLVRSIAYIFEGEG